MIQFNLTSENKDEKIQLCLKALPFFLAALSAFSSRCLCVPTGFTHGRPVFRGATGTGQVEGGQRSREGEREMCVARAGEPRGAIPLPRGLLLVQVGGYYRGGGGVWRGVGLGSGMCDCEKFLASFKIGLISVVCRSLSPPPSHVSQSVVKRWLLLQQIGVKAGTCCARCAVGHDDRTRVCSLASLQQWVHICG